VRQPPPPSQLKPLAAASSDILQPLTPVSFDDLMLEEEQQHMLDEVCVELEYRVALAERKLRARNRLLFHGPPGNGKTSSAVALAGALGIPAFGVSIPDLVSKWLGGTAENLGQMFKAIGPDTVVVFDELDAVGASRTGADSSAGKEFNSVVNTLLTLLDRCKDGLIIGTTNRPDILDPALLRRFDEQILFPAPNFAQMAALAEKLCGHYGIGAVDISDCRNFDNVTKTVERAARRVVMRELLAADEAAEEGTEESEGENENGEEQQEEARQESGRDRRIH
jgi:SpoVK/Ycf46/Vps4 family AAA+-type ATPase